MAIAHTLAPVLIAVTAGTTAVAVDSASNGVRVTSWTLQNTSTASCYVGGSAVTTSTGFLVAAGTSVSFDRERLRQEAQTYAISNYYVVTAATGAAMVAMYNAVTDRG